MPLRDHFHPPLNDIYHWQGLLCGWPVMMVAALHGKLSGHYFAEPSIGSMWNAETAKGATTIWTPPQPTLTALTDLPAQDVYEVRVYEERRRARLAWIPTLPH